MLWHVDNTTLWILGSVHVSDRPLLIARQTTRVLDNADVLAFEANFEVEPNLAPARYEIDNTLSKNIPALLFDDTRRLWRELCLNEEELEGLRPWWVAFRLMNASMLSRGFVREQGVDQRVLKLGKRDNKRLYFLESIDAGVSTFANAPLHEQKVFLSRAAQHNEEGLQEVASLVAGWESSNPENLLPIVERALCLMPITYTAALAGRNSAWLRHLLRFIRSRKNAVVVVGMLHMVGPKNIPSFLASQGFKCSLVE